MAAQAEASYNATRRGAVQSDGSCRLFSLDEVLTATNNFDDAFVIGTGGFGKVYKGLINHDNNCTEIVALKRLNAESKQGAGEFWTEIEMLSKLRHPNLVSLIGYCDELSEMILVYEYIGGGTLANNLYKLSSKSVSPLTWEQRLKICIGAASGLNFLHAGTNQSFIHRDVKTTNILLNSNWVAKICDFGLSKGISSHSITHVSTYVKGTFGYFDPEYFLTQRLTTKSDVYAFGVVLLEVLCGRPPVDTRLVDEQIGLVDWVEHCIQKGKLDVVIDPSLGGQIAPRSLKSFVELASKCLHKGRTSRPTMAEVLGSLELTLVSQQKGGTEGIISKAFLLMDGWLRFRKDDGSSGGQSKDVTREPDENTDSCSYSSLIEEGYRTFVGPDGSSDRAEANISPDSPEFVSFGSEGHQLRWERNDNGSSGEESNVVIREVDENGVSYSHSSLIEEGHRVYGNYNTSFSGKWDASHSGPIDSPSHPTLYHSTLFSDSPHSQRLQVVPYSTSEGSLKVLLLHGNLDIWVYEAKNLPNHKISSDPYVSISVSSALIGITYVNSNSEDPVWMQRFYIPVAHYAAEVHFFVKDSDVVGSQLRGVVAIPVEQIYLGAKVQGFYPILNSNGEPCKPGAVLSLSIQYTPIDVDNMGIYRHGVGAGPDYFGVPGTYFPLRRGGTVTLYQDAHVPDDCIPNLELDRGMHYVQGKCWRDIFDAIRQARRLVYITAWSVWHQVRLVRDDNAAVYTLGDLLKSKSQEGVRVLLLVWKDPTSRSILGYKTDGIMQTHDQETRRFFENSSVQVLLCSRMAGKKPGFFKQREIGTIYTHHQKTVIVDADAGNNRRKIIAFLGGLDLCDGRYDTPQHPIFRTLHTVHSDDYLNPTYMGNVAGCPREPWHDLHCKIDGPAAYDVLTNFEERWLKASKPDGIKKLKMSYDDSLLRIDRIPDIAGVIDTPCVSENDPEGWHVQIFRSIDSNSVREFPNDPKEAISKNLMCGKNVLIDMSIHTAYVKAIRAAQHYIYIENQYFLGSSYNWSSHKDLGANNLIPMEVALKIADKIRAHERFSVYIVIPMWPEGNPTSAATQRILFWQKKTMEMMYETIYKALVEVGLEDAFTPQDYLNFYCLGNREVVGNEISASSRESSAPADSPQALGRKYRRFMIYVHSKGMIVDDEFVILGSANMNQRSMEGTRDTEIAMGAYQPHHTWAKKSSNPHGQIYGYRLSLWAEHLGTIEECFTRPESIECVRKVRSMGEANWKQFESDEVTEMRGHLMKYPLDVDWKGKVRPLPGCETFPDVGGQIVGSFLAFWKT